MNGKLRLLLTAKLLQERTDDNHSLTRREICEILSREYGIEAADRNTFTADINALRESGMEIEEDRGTQKKYRYIGRDLDHAELKLIIDAVKSFRSITKQKSDELAKKLSRYAGPGDKSLSRHTEVENRIRNGNKKLFLIIDTIHRAIEQKKQLSFFYFKYNEKKERILQHGGKPYRFNPAFLVWTGEYYYLVGCYANHPETTASFRVDRISEKPEILDAPCAKLPSGFDPEQYLNSTIHMFGGTDGKQETVELLCENSTASAIIDRFGLQTKMVQADADHFTATIFVSPTSVFYGWIFGFGGKVKILSPKLAAEYERMVRKVEDLLI